MNNILIITDFIQLSPTAYGGAPFQKGAFLVVASPLASPYGRGGTQSVTERVVITFGKTGE